MNGTVKPCPFCGGKASVSKCFNTKYSASCSVCAAATAYYFNEDDAITAWNRRMEADIETKAFKVIDLLTESRDVLGEVIADLKKEHEELKRELDELKSGGGK